MGFRWDGREVVDSRLNFGQRNAPEVAYRFAMVVLWLVRRRVADMAVGWVALSVVCDDWLIQALTRAACAAVWQMVIDVLEALGFAINRAPHKCIPPCHRLPWLGLGADGAAMTVSLPAEKVAKALAAIRGALAAVSVTRRSQGAAAASA